MRKRSENRNVKVIKRKKRQNYDFLLLHKEYEVLRMARS